MKMLANHNLYTQAIDVHDGTTSSNDVWKKCPNQSNNVNHSISGPLRKNLVDQEDNRHDWIEFD